MLPSPRSVVPFPTRTGAPAKNLAFAVFIVTTHSSAPFWGVLQLHRVTASQNNIGWSCQIVRVNRIQSSTFLFSTSGEGFSRRCTQKWTRGSHKKTWRRKYRTNSHSTELKNGKLKVCESARPRGFCRGKEFLCCFWFFILLFSSPNRRNLVLCRCPRRHVWLACAETSLLEIMEAASKSIDCHDYFAAFEKGAK